jgi:hypothetical protein
MLDAYRWDIRDAQEPCGSDSTVPRNNSTLGVDQNRNYETKQFDASGNLRNLLLRVQTSIFRVEFEPSEGPIIDV